jgi:hypothetical protein
LPPGGTSAVFADSGARLAIALCRTRLDARSLPVRSAAQPQPAPRRGRSADQGGSTTSALHPRRSDGRRGSSVFFGARKRAVFWVPAETRQTRRKRLPTHDRVSEISVLALAHRALLRAERAAPVAAPWRFGEYRTYSRGDEGIASACAAFFRCRLCRAHGLGISSAGRAHLCQFRLRT